MNEAGIPRGSFYQYFEDKEDLLRFLIQATRKKGEMAMLQELREFDLDVYDFILMITRRELIALEQNEEISPRMRLLRMIARSPRASSIFNEEIGRNARKSEYFERGWEKAGLKDLDEHTRYAVMSLLLSAMKETLIAVLGGELGTEVAMERLELKLRIVREGARHLP